MLLAIDVGNTNVTVGAFQGADLACQWRLETEPGRAADEYGALLEGLVSREAPGSVTGVALASVVPALTPVFERVAKRYFGKQAFVADHRIRGVRFAVDRPAEVGADRVVNALAALKLHGAPAVVLDFGTATTFDCLSRKGYYLGGAILAGPRLVAEALAEKTAKLPKVEFAKPKHVIGRNTVECIQAGLYYGYLGMVERVLDRTLQEMEGKPKILVTGGFAELFSPLLRKRNSLVPDLTLQGLRLAFEDAQNRL